MLKLLKKMRNKKGFTLVELMVVVVIIGILVAIAIPVYNGTQANAKLRACQANLRTLDGAVAMWASETGGNPAAVIMDNLVPSYVKDEPFCPVGRKIYTLTTTTETTPATDPDGTPGSGDETEAVSTTVGRAVCPNGHTY